MSKDKEQDPSNDGMKKPKPPSLFKMAANFAKDLTKYVKEGAPNVTHQQYTKRLEACKACPHLIKESFRCGLCGCLLEHKAKWRTTTCPANPTKWDPLYLSPEDLVKMETAKNMHEEEQSRKEVDMRAVKHKKLMALGRKLQQGYKEGKWRPEDLVKGDMDKAKFKPPLDNVNIVKSDEKIYPATAEDLEFLNRKTPPGKHPKEYGPEDEEGGDKK